jgi:hypothetical protein
MNRVAILSATALVLAAVPGKAAAPVVAGKWTNTTPQLFIHVDMPVPCDAATFRAKDTWNSRGTKWFYNWSSSNYQSDFVAYTGRVTIAPQGDIPTGVQATTSQYGNPIYSAWVGVSDKVMFWNPGGWYDEGEFYCPGTRTTTPTDKFSYEYTIVHELGHALGFGHHQVNDFNCIMTTYGRRGDNRTTPCTDEKNTLLQMYGAR